MAGDSLESDSDDEEEDKDDIDDKDDDENELNSDSMSDDGGQMSAKNLFAVLGEEK